MNKFTRQVDKIEESFSKGYFTLVSLVEVAVILIINFKVMPAMIDVIVSPEEMLKIKSRIPKMSIGFLVFVLLFNALFWLRAKVWRKERKQAQENLSMNPNDPVAQKELAKIDVEVKTFLSRMEFFLVLGSGLAVFWLLYNILGPIYGLSP